MSETEQKQHVESSGKSLVENSSKQGLKPLDLIDELFDDLHRSWLSQWFVGRGLPSEVLGIGTRFPRIDVIDRDDEVCVKAELPGIQKDNLSVTLQDNLLHIRASLEKEEKEEKGTYHRKELLQGTFHRSIQLPAPVDSEKVKATFKDGILELSLPKAADYCPKKINVE